MTNKLRYTAVFVVLFLSASPALATLNVLPIGSKSNSSEFSGNITGSMVLETGNISWLSFNPAVSLRYSAGGHTVLLKTSTEFFAQNRISIINRGFEHLRYSLEIIDTLKWESFIQHQFDEFRNVKFRGLAGTGLALSYEIGSSLTFAIAAAYMFEYEVEQATETLQAKESNHRLSSYIQAQWWLTDTMTLGLITFYQPRLDNFADIRCLGESSFTIRGNEWLSMQLTFSLGYDTQPFVGVEKMDTTTKTSLIVDF